MSVPAPDEAVECFALDSDGEVYWPGQDVEGLSFSLEEGYVLPVCFPDDPNTELFGQPG